MFAVCRPHWSAVRDKHVTSDKSGREQEGCMDLRWPGSNVVSVAEIVFMNFTNQNKWTHLFCFFVILKADALKSRKKCISVNFL